MADELEFKITNFTFEKGGVKVERAPGSVDVTITGDHAIHKTQEIGTSAENLDKGEITTPGYGLFHNLDGTNFVEIGYDDTGFKPTVKIESGEWALFRLAQATPQAKADTAACDLEFILIED